jgi:hypothetical protein
MLRSASTKHDLPYLGEEAFERLQRFITAKVRMANSGRKNKEVITTLHPISEEYMAVLKTDSLCLS